MQLLARTRALAIRESFMIHKAPEGAAVRPVEGKMIALGKLKNEKGIWRMDAEVPSMLPHEVLIKVNKTAICGTDLHIHLWDEWAQKTIPWPMITGHEFTGEIVALGDSVPRGTGPKFLQIGRRVSGEGHLVCGFCRACRAHTPHLCRHTIGVGVNRQGCFAQYLVIPAYNVFPLPQHISDDYASILDPFGNATHTALSFELLGEDVLITGAGPIGCMAVAVCKKAGARFIVVSDPNPWRRQLAMKMGATIAYDPRETTALDVADKLGMAEGFDVGLEMSGNGTALSTMVDSMCNGGKIALLGIPPASANINWQNVVFRGVEIRGIYGRKMFETWYKMSALLESGLDLSPVITHRMSVMDFEKGFAAMEGGECGKVILDWEAAHKANPLKLTKEFEAKVAKDIAAAKGEHAR